MKKLLLLLSFSLLLGTVFAFTGNFNSYQWKFNPSVKHYFDNGSTLKVCAKFTQNFIDKYKYEESTNYRFALNVKINWVGGWYNTLRNKNNGVSNRKWHLDWAVSAKEFVKWYCWNIPLNTKLKFASNTYVPWRQIVYKILPNGWKLTAYLSATKELKGWELANITREIK